MECSLFSPVRNLPWYLLPIWPLIFWRIQRVKAWFQRAGGPGSGMLWGLDAWGRVVIHALSDDLTGRRRTPLPNGEPPSALRAALNGEDFHLRHTPAIELAAALRATLLEPVGAVCRWIARLVGAHLPLPDT